MRMLVELPNGVVIDAPEGTTREAIKQKAIRNGLATHMDFGSEEYGAPTEGMSKGELFRAGMGKAAVDLARGAGDLVSDMFGQGMDDKVRQARVRDQSLMDTGWGQAGNLAGNVAFTAPTALIPGVNTVGGASAVGAGIGALQGTAEGESRLLNAGLGAAAGAGGQWGANKLGGLLSKSPQRAAAAKAQNALRDEAAQAARSVGYSLPPVHTNPRSVTNQLLEGVSGKYLTQQRAASMNQNVTNKLARKALGLAEDAPLTEEVLRSIRAKAGTAYDDIAKAVDEYIPDDVVVKKLDEAFGPYKANVSQYPEDALKSVELLEAKAYRGSHEGKALVHQIRKLRKDATALFRAADDPEKLTLAHLYKKVANALEDMVERNLSKAGKGELVKRFKESRVKIAKAHTVEDALTELGDVDAVKLARTLDKGAPLSGDLKKIAQAASSYPKALKHMDTSVNPISLPTIGFGAAGVGLGSPEMVALAAARPLIREGILSQPYQSIMGTSSYNPVIQQALGGLLGSRAGQHTSRVLAPSLMFGSLR